LSPQDSAAILHICMYTNISEEIPGGIAIQLLDALSVCQTLSDSGSMAFNETCGLTYTRRIQSQP
jgi:hypothetical protein